MKLGLFFDVRKIFSALRGGTHPFEIALGICLGLLIGLTPFGLHLLLPVGALLVFRCSTGLALFSFAVSKGFYLLLAGAFYRTGFYLLNNTNLFDPLVRQLNTLPVLGLMGWNRYLLFGAYAVVFMASLVLFPLIYFAVNTFREKIVQWLLDFSLVSSFVESRTGAFLIWLCFGPAAERSDDDPDESDADGEQKTGTFKRMISGLFGLFRWKMTGPLIGFCIIVTALSAIGYAFSFDRLISATLTRASGTNVTLKTASLSPFTGRLTLNELSAEDPENSSRNLFTARRTVMDLNLYRLFAGYAHVSEMSVTGLRFDVRRRSDGTLNLQDLGTGPSEEPKKDPEKEQEESYVAWLKKKGKSVDWVQLIKKYLEHRRKKPDEQPPKKPPSEEQPEPDDKKKQPKPTVPGVEYRNGKRVVVFDANAAYPLENTIPFFVIERIQLKDCKLNVSDETRQEKELPPLQQIDGSIRSITSDFELHGKPLQLDVQGEFAGDAGGTLSLKGSYQPKKETSLNVSAKALNLLRFRGLYETSLPVNIREGRMSTTLAGAIRRGKLSVPVDIAFQNLNLSRKQSGHTLFGLDAETTKYVLKGINAYGKQKPIAFRFMVSGPVNNPEVHWKAHFLKVAKEGLKSLGKEQFNAYINKIDSELKTAKKRVESELRKEGKKRKENLVQSIKSGDTRDLQKQLKSGTKNKGNGKDDVQESIDKVKDLNPFSSDDEEE